MNKLVAAMNAESVTTENGMPTFATSLDASVDFFGKAAAMRGQDVTPLFSAALAEEPMLAGRLALWLRDIRGGAGEREVFRDVIKYLAGKDRDMATAVMRKIPELGRWDDVLELFGTDLERDALSMINHALRDGDVLCAKWMPRKGSRANKIRAYMQSSPKVYRKLLASLSNTVEQKMCAKEFDKINYSHVPSVAAARYQKAFTRNDEAGYAQYRVDLEKGVDKEGKVVKINAGAVYPYDVIKSLRTGVSAIADQQWKALPDYLEGSDANILCLIDSSGSMCSAINGTGGWGTNSNEVSCMDVAAGLGIYLSERSRGIFKDTFLTFNDKCSMITLKGSLSDKHSQIERAEWGGSTNLESAFELILDSAVKHGLAPEDMPTQLLILSDMQFNSCVRKGDDKAIEMMERMYKDAGYTLPVIVFWNIRASNGSPVTADQRGTCLVSGCSPAIMASVLDMDADEFTPRAMMLKAIMNERYSF